MWLLRALKRILNQRDRYHSLRMRHSRLFPDRQRSDQATRGEHASFDPVERSPTSLLRDAGFNANTKDEVRDRRQTAIERERKRRQHVHRRKAPQGWR